MSENRKTDVNDFIGECGAGMLTEKLAMALSDAANAQLYHGAGNKKAKVSVEFSFQQMGDNEQVIISHKLTTSTPTKRGKKFEEDITDSVFFVGKFGTLTSTAPKEEESGQFTMKVQEDGEKTNKIGNVRRIAQ
jgi:hypothetical protein